MLQHKQRDFYAKQAWKGLRYHLLDEPCRLQIKPSRVKGYALANDAEAFRGAAQETAGQSTFK